MIQLIEPSEALRVARLFPAASKDPTRPVLSGLRIEPISPTRLVCAATDGFVLAWTFLDRDEPHGLAEALTAPNPIFKTLHKAAKGRVKPFLAFDPEASELRLGSKDGTFTAKPEPGDYPAWRRVLPGQSTEFQVLEHGVDMKLGFQWRLAEILSDPSDPKFDGPGAITLPVLGVRAGLLLMFYRDGVYAVGQETRWPQRERPKPDLVALHAGLEFRATEPVP